MPLSSITNIPKIMRANGWNQGAALLDKWFREPPSAMPLYINPDFTTIKMDWILSFRRAKDVYDQMIADKVWMNDAAKPVAASRFRERNTIDVCFDFSRLTQEGIHTIHVNTRPVQSGYGTSFDGLVAALGNSWPAARDQDPPSPAPSITPGLMLRRKPE